MELPRAGFVLLQFGDGPAFELRERSALSEAMAANGIPTHEEVEIDIRQLHLRGYEADAIINEARYPDPDERALARHGEAGPGNLPDDEELERLGVDRLVLARHLVRGMDAQLFTRAIYEAELAIDAFNDSFEPDDASPFSTEAGADDEDVNRGLRVILGDE